MRAEEVVGLGELDSLAAAALDSQAVVAPEGTLGRVVHKMEGTRGVDMNLEERMRMAEVEADRELGHIGHTGHREE